MKAIREWRDDKRVVVRERALNKIKADGTGIDDDQSCVRGSRGVNDGGAKRSLDQGIDVSGRAKWLAVLAVGLRSAAVKRSQVEQPAGCSNVLRYRDSMPSIEGIVLTILGMVGESKTIPVKIPPRINEVRRACRNS